MIISGGLDPCSPPLNPRMYRRPLTLKALAKKSASDNVCLRLLLHIFDNIIGDVNIEANSVEPDQSDLDLHYLSKRLLKHFNRRQKQATFVVVSGLVSPADSPSNSLGADKAEQNVGPYPDQNCLSL